MKGTRSHLKLHDFDISEETGFLPPNPPLRRLTREYFSSWEDTCAEIPHLIEKKQLRAQIDGLPERDFNEETLKSEEEWRRAYVLLTFLSQSYIWAEGEAGVVEKLPKKLAVPWCAVSEHVSLQPVATYGSNVLYNYSLRDPDSGLFDDNLIASSTFTGTGDESWFYMIHVLVELAAIPAIKALEHSYRAMDEEQNEQLVSDLELIGKSLLDMRDCLKQCQRDVILGCSTLGFDHFRVDRRESKPFPMGSYSRGWTRNPSNIMAPQLDRALPSQCLMFTFK